MEDKIRIGSGKIIEKAEIELSARRYSFVQSFSVPCLIIEELRKHNDAMEKMYAEKYKIKNEDVRAKNYFSLRIEKIWLSAGRFQTTFEDGASANWLIKFTITKDAQGREHLTVYICLTGYAGVGATTEATPGLNALYQVSILDSAGSQVYQKSSAIRRFSFQSTPSWGWQYYIPVHKLGRAHEHISFRARMWTMKDEGQNDVPDQGITVISAGGDSNEATVTTGAWFTDDNWDLIIECTQASFRAHRAILATASPVLATMTESPRLQEVHQMNRKRYKISMTNSDTDTAIVEKILEFCYTRNTVVFEDTSQCAKLCEIGFNWQMKELTKEAFLQLSKPDRLDLVNFPFIFLRSEYVRDQPDALRNVEEFIVKNHTELKKLNEFPELMRRDGIAQIYASILFK